MNAVFPPHGGRLDRPPTRLARRPVACALLVGCLLASASSGCVYRRMTIRTDPPGALVVMDGREVGFTPYTADFIYYGTREITLVKDGYETQTIYQPFRVPWYQVPPIEFFADNLLPFKVTNRHEFVYALEPQQVAPVDQLLERANGLRSETQLGP